MERACPRHWNVRTFRLRQDLQFIDSRGSLLIRRAGSLSMPTCGRDIVRGWIPCGGGTMPVASKGPVMTMKDVIRQECKWSKTVMLANERE